MKMKTRMLVAAVAMAGAAQANAALINIDSDPVNAPGAGNGSGDLFLSVEYTNGTSTESYVMNTGITVSQFRSSTFTSDSIAETANLQELLNLNASSPGTVTWTMGAIDNEGLPNNGYYATSGTTLIGTLSPGSNVPGGGTGIGGAQANAETFINSVNTQNTNQTVDGSASELLTGGSSALLKGTNGYIGPGWDGGTNSLTSTIGNSMSMYFVGIDNDFVDSDVTKYGQWTLESNGTLVYSTSVQAVPLPPAVWLLGSALVGLVGVGRRRNVTDLAA